MSYSRETLAAFSDALAALYSTAIQGAALGATLPKGAQVQSRDHLSSSASISSETPEDLAYLEELLAAHRKAAACVRDQASAPASQPDRDMHAFLRLCEHGLTSRECEILFWIAEGKRDAEIAAILGCATKTVGKHVENILGKLFAETRLGAVHAATQWLQART